MERYKVIAVIFFTGLLLVMWADPSGAQEDPVIEIDVPTHDFGQVTEGEVVEHDFRVLNRGVTSLEIKEVKPG